jgi:KDO2-lipid IV(A) lauroyltransferase
MNKKYKNLYEYFLFKVAIKTLSLLPFELAFYLSAKLGVFVGMILGIRKKVAHSQLRKSFPTMSEQEIKKILIRMYENIGYQSIEFFLGDKKNLLKKITPKGFQYLIEAYKKNKGVIVVSGHFGNWEMAGEFIASKGIRIGAIVKRQRNPYVNEYIEKRRKDSKIHLIYKKRSFRGIVKELKNGAAIAFLSDQSANRQGIQLNFLGRKASVNIGAAKLALKFSVPIVFCYSLREPDNSLSLHFHKPIFIEELDENQKNIKYITQTLNNEIENVVKEHPENWFWVHKRWKNANQGKKPNLYV